MGALYGPHGPEEIPGALNLILAGALPAWESTRAFEALRRSQHRLALFTSVLIGARCVLATLLISIVFEGATMLLGYGELRVRFLYTNVLGFFVLKPLVVVPVGVSIGMLGQIWFRAMPPDEHNAGIASTSG